MSFKIQEHRGHTVLSPKRHLLGVFLAIIIIAAILGYLEWSGVTHIFYASKPPISADANTKGEPSSTDSSKSQTKSTSPSGDSTDNTAQPGDTKSDTGGNVTTNLETPTGDFVSNHNPGQNGSPNTEVSVCNTSPGATCQIIFTRNGITRSLPKQTTDRGGSTYWNNWTPAQLGLTSGSWQIKAIATTTSQTQTTTDATDLTVPQ